MTLAIRSARRDDKKRILEISAQIWDGGDYVPSVFDSWVDDADSELAVAEQDGLVIAFARRGWLVPGYAWLQGIRSDPAHRGHGAGRAITEHFIAQARREGADTIGLSTYIDNEASIHIIESYGFRRVAAFVLAEAEEIGPEEAGPAASNAVTVGSERAISFIRSSMWHRIANGHYPWDWSVYPFDRAPERAIDHTPFKLAVVEDGRIRSLLCTSPQQATGETTFLSFLDGDPGDFTALLARARRELKPTAWATMIPRNGERKPPAHEFLLSAGLKPWMDGSEDVFAYELDLASESSDA